MTEASIDHTSEAFVSKPSLNKLPTQELRVAFMKKKSIILYLKEKDAKNFLDLVCYPIEENKFLYEVEITTVCELSQLEAILQYYALSDWKPRTFTRPEPHQSLEDYKLTEAEYALLFYLSENSPQPKHPHSKDPGHPPLLLRLYNICSGMAQKMTPPIPPSDNNSSGETDKTKEREAIGPSQVVNRPVESSPGSPGAADLALSPLKALQTYLLFLVAHSLGYREGSMSSLSTTLHSLSIAEPFDQAQEQALVRRHEFLSDILGESLLSLSSGSSSSEGEEEFEEEFEEEEGLEESQENTASN